MDGNINHTQMCEKGMLPFDQEAENKNSDLYLCVGCWYWYNDPVATVRFQSWKISEKLERGENIHMGKATIGEESRKREEKKVSQSHSIDWNVCQQKMKWDKFRLQRKQIIIFVEIHQEHILLNGRSMKVAIHSQTEQSPQDV